MDPSTRDQAFFRGPKLVDLGELSPGNPVEVWLQCLEMRHCLTVARCPCRLYCGPGKQLDHGIDVVGLAGMVSQP